MTVHPTPRVSIVVLSWNTRDLLRNCLRALEADPHRAEHQLIVVDNGSDDQSPEMVELEFPDVLLIRNGRNLGYAEGNNVGIRAARGRYVLLLNSDTEAGPESLSRLADFLESHPLCGAVGSQLFEPDGTVQRACMRFPTLAVLIGYDTCFGRRVPLKRAIDNYFYREFDHLSSRDVDQPPGAALMVPKRLYDSIGLLDPDLYLFFNDVDLCRRIRRAGYTIHYLVESKILHHGGASTSRYGLFAQEWHINRARYYLRSHGLPGFWLAKLMSAWRALEEWWKSVRRIQDPEDRKFAEENLHKIVRLVFDDSGGGDPRVR